MIRPLALPLPAGPLPTRRHPLLRHLVSHPRRPSVVANGLSGFHWIGLLVVLVAVGAVLLLLGRMKRRGRSRAVQPELGDFAQPPADFGSRALRAGTFGEPVAAVAGAYVGTVVSGEGGIGGVDQPFGWRAQDPTHGATPVSRLSGRGAAEVTVEQRGVLIRRDEATTIYLPTAELRGARLAAPTLGAAGEACVTLVWEHAHTRLETIFEPGLRADRDRLVYDVTTVIREGIPT